MKTQLTTMQVGESKLFSSEKISSKRVMISQFSKKTDTKFKTTITPEGLKVERVK